MALIPDEAIDRMYRELTSGARDLYVYLARCRNQKTGKCCPSVQTIMSSIGLSRPRVYAMRKELDVKGWAKFQANNAELLIGFKITESLENETTNGASKESNLVASESLENKTPSLENKTNSLENKTNSLENETNLSCFQDSHIRKNQQRNQQREPAKEPCEPATADSTQDPLSIAQEILGEIPIYHQELILNADVQQLTAWRKTCQDWQDNRYSKRNITGLIDSYYRAEVQTKKEKDRQNGTSIFPVRESNGERAARESLELIAALTDQGRSSDHPGAENKIAGFLAGTQWS